MSGPGNDERRPARGGVTVENHLGAGLSATIAPGAREHHAMVRQIVDAAPPLTAHQRGALSVLLLPTTATAAAR
jgi:hypothetical protein